MPDLLKVKRLREAWGELRNQIVTTSHQYETRLKSGGDMTDAEYRDWQADNARYDQLKIEIHSAEKEQGYDMTNYRNLPGRGDMRRDPDDDDDETTDPRRFDMAVGGWLKNAAGIPVNDDCVAACRSLGVSIHSGSIDIPYTRSLRPVTGREWFGRHAVRAGAETRALSHISGPAGAYVAGEAGFMQALELAMLNESAALGAYEVLTTDTGNDLPWPTCDDTSNEGAIIGENTQVSKQDITFGAHILRAHKGTSKLVRIPTELMQDSAINLAQTVGEILGQRLGRLLNRLTTVGTGASQPTGIVTAATVGVTAASATAIAADEILDLIHSVDPSYRTNAKFQMADSTILAVRKLKDGNGQYLWQPGMQQGQPDRLCGYEVIPNRHMSTISTGAKPIAFGDMSKYKVRLAGGVRIRRLVERYADYDQDGFVAFNRFDGALLDAGTGPVKVLQMA